MVDSKIRKQIIDLISENFNATACKAVILPWGWDMTA